MPQEKYTYHQNLPKKIIMIFVLISLLYCFLAVVALVSFPAYKIEETAIIVLSVIALLALFILLLWGIVYCFRKIISEKYMEEIVFFEKGFHSKEVGEIRYAEIADYKITEAFYGLTTSGQNIPPSLVIELQTGKEIKLSPIPMFDKEWEEFTAFTDAFAMGIESAQEKR